MFAKCVTIDRCEPLPFCFWNKKWGKDICRCYLVPRFRIFQETDGLSHDRRYKVRRNLACICWRTGRQLNQLNGLPHHAQHRTQVHLRTDGFRFCVWIFMPQRSESFSKVMRAFRRSYEGQHSRQHPGVLKSGSRALNSSFES